MSVPGVCKCAAGGALALLLMPGAARAIGVDGAGQRVIVPLVVANQGPESLVTLSNPGPETIRVNGIFVGAEGTQAAASLHGPVACDAGDVPAHESVTRHLRELCPHLPHDGELLGYLSLFSTADARPNFFATSVAVTPSVQSSAQYGVTGQPIGAFDPGFASPPFGLHVAGLRTLATHSEVLTCYVATLDEAKKLSVELRDAKSVPVGSPIPLQLDPERMQVFDVEARAGLAPADRDDLSVVFESSEGAVVIAGCGPKLQSNGVRAYQPAQTAVPADRARLRSVAVELVMRPGPFTIFSSWTHTKAGNTSDAKVTLSSYFRPSDEVRCALIPWSDPTGGPDPSPYLEIRIVDPKGTVIGGGSGVKDTGAVATRPQGAYPAYLSQRHLIEISFDEDTAWPGGPNAMGGWAIACESGAGMSEPVPMPVVYGDDF